MSTAEDLRQTATDVQALGRRVSSHTADVRDLEQLRTAVDHGVASAWNTMVVSASHLISNGGGSIVLHGSIWGVKGLPSKHGLVGITKTLANEFAQHNIRLNIVHPGGVATELTNALAGIGELINSNPQFGGSFMNALPVEKLASNDIRNAVLSSHPTRQFVTGTELTVDAGNTNS